MIDGIRITAFVPARAGSKGIPRKNLQLVGGRSLLQWAVDLAQSMEEIDRCVVSTDGEEIAEEVQCLGAYLHKRPAHLATDDALVVDTIRDAIADRSTKLTGGVCVLLEPTSPFRTVDDVRSCIRGLYEGADSAATFTDAALHPNRAFVIDGNHAKPYLAGAVPWQPRQTLRPPAYQLTGAVYAFWSDRLPPSGASILFGKMHPVVVPRSRSLDIDDHQDLELANAILR